MKVNNLFSEGPNRFSEFNTINLIQEVPGKKMTVREFRRLAKSREKVDLVDKTLKQSGSRVPKTFSILKWQMLSK